MPDAPDENRAPDVPADSPAPALDLRVAEITEAGEHPNADRLLLLRIDLGSERRQLVAGLAGIYDPAELVGKRIVVVANLKPARLRGELSQGMLLAAHGDDAVGLLLAPDASPGTRLETAGGARTATPDAAADGAAGAEPDSAGPEITIDDFARHEIVATADGVALDGQPIERPRLVVDRDAWGRVK